MTLYLIQPCWMAFMKTKEIEVEHTSTASDIAKTTPSLLINLPKVSPNKLPVASYDSTAVRIPIMAANIQKRV